MPLGGFWTLYWPTLQRHLLPSERVCVYSPLLPVCVSLTRVRFESASRKETWYSLVQRDSFLGFLPSLCFYGDLCVCTGFTWSLERSRFREAASGGFYFFSFLVVVSAKITAGSQGSVVKRKRWCCWVTMLSLKCPGNVGLHIWPANSCSQTAAAALRSTCEGISARWRTRY